jgi:subfamily B ATP-binding cassette protein MsbA
MQQASGASIPLLKRLLRRMRPYRRRIVFSLLCMLAVAVLTAVITWLIKPLLDEGLFARPQTLEEKRAAFMMILKLAGLGLLLTALKSLARYGVDYLVGNVGQRVVYDLRFALFSRLQSLSLGFYHERKTGELLSRVITDVGAMQTMITQYFGQALSSMVSILGLSAYLFYLNWKLAVLALLVFPVAVWPIRNFGRRLRGLSRQVQELYADLAAHLEETLSQMKLVHAYQGENREVERWRGKLSEQITVLLRALRVQARSSPIMETIGAAGFAGLMIYSGYEILLKGTMTGGALGSFLTGVLQLYPNIKHLNGLWNNIQTGLGAAERVFPLLDEEPAIRDAPDAVPLAPFQDSIRYDRVTFSFRPGEPVLRDVTLAIRRGQRVAFVGPSGAGKTTLMDLLLRFYDPGEGRVLLDGRDLRLATLASLRAQIALVSQEVLLFNATVRDNLLYARPGASDSEMESAAQAAGAHEFISALPKGYGTVIGERGVKLSGGERQRLSIARAFLKDAPILVLDEATAALDAASEALVQRALEELMAHRTVLIIAHRLATVRHADTICVMQEGRIVDAGTHEELYARGGLYRQLCDLQFRDAPLPA